MVSRTDIPGISAENNRFHNSIVGIGYILLVLIVIGAAAPAEDTGTASTPTATPTATAQTTADTAQTTAAQKNAQKTKTQTETKTKTKTKTKTETETKTQTQTKTKEPDKGYQIRISYDGEWSGSIGAGGSSRTVDGSGTETFDVKKDDAFSIAANAQKQDNSDAKLTVQILKDGAVVAEQSTTAAYGLAQATHSTF